jgi:hypothetical protein
VADKQNNLYNTAREAEQKSMQETVKLRQELRNKLQEIDTNEELSDDEKR